MGSKQSLSNGNEPGEVTDLLRGFQELNQVSIVITLQLTPDQGRPALLATAVATNVHVDPVVRARWELVHVAQWGREYKSLVGLVTGLLYRLDFAVGEEEMRSIGIEKA